MLAYTLKVGEAITIGHDSPVVADLPMLPTGIATDVGYVNTKVS